MTLCANTEKLLQHPKALCNMLRRLAVEAGDHTLQYFDESGSQSQSQTELKEDGSPVTIADREAEEIILKALTDMMPDVPVVGEESIAAGIFPDLNGHDWFFLVDPVDGTREFIRGSPDYTVNIALIHKGVPVIGVVYAPVTGELYAGHGAGTAIRWLADTNKEKPIRVRDMPPKGLTVVTSRSTKYQDQMDVFLADFKIAKAQRRGSSLKICLIAAGKADIYPRFGLTSEWDTAAGDAVLRSAGGHIVTMQGDAMTYGYADRKFLNPEFVASSGFWPPIPGV
jgi:3'(2'), 5'-bisphosphate nucleotidase